MAARIEQEKQLAALEAQQADMLRKRDFPQHRDVDRNPSPSQQKSVDQVMLLKQCGVTTDSIYCPHFQRKRNFVPHFSDIINLLVL